MICIEHGSMIGTCLLNIKHTSAKNEVQTAFCNMKDSLWTSRAAELQQAADKKDTKAFYEGLRKVYGPRDGGNSPVLSAEVRTLQTDKEDILLRWREHLNPFLTLTTTPTPT